jgi:hypothetical protein
MSLAKRVLLFVLLGPLLGFVMAFWVMLPIASLALGEGANVDLGQVMILPIAYIVGAAPAALAGAIDHLMAGKIRRPLWTALAGYMLGFVPILAGLLMGFMHGPFLLVFGLIGAVPALVCSLMVNVFDGRARNYQLE